MKPARHSLTDRGAIILVALCFAAVLGISLASYLAVSSQAMRLSNRAFQADVSRQLAEAGLVQALATLNTNDWTGWTISGTTASRTVTFPANKFGPLNVTGSFKIRIDNYTAFSPDATWDSTATYSIGDVVGRSGTWYTSLINNNTNNQPPNRRFWIEHGVGWRWNSTTAYRVEDMVNRNGNWYRCTSAHTNQAPPSGGSSNAWWTFIPYLTADNNLFYVNESIVNWYGTWYRYNWGWDSAPAMLWRWRQSYGYQPDDLVCYNNVWYRATTSHTSTWSNRPGASSSWALVSDPWNWNSSNTYNPGDVVFRSGSWYRALVTHSNQAPPNATFWSNTPAGTVDYLPGDTYQAGSVVRHQGVWYYTASTTTNRPPAAPWTSAATPTWNPATAYASGAFVSYGGIWYRCIAAHTNRSPNNASFWSAVGAPVVISEGSASFPDGPVIRTQLRALTGPAALFPNALAGTESVTLGASSLIDSYDPGAGTYASQVGTAANFQAVVAGGRESTASTAVALSSATVRGFVTAPPATTSPFDPRVTYAGSATLRNADGTVTSPAPSAANVDLSRISRSPFIPQFDIQDVSGGTTLPSSINNLVLGTPGDIAPSVYVYNDHMTLETATAQITVTGPVILRINGRLRIRNNVNARIIIAPTGSLRLHVASDFDLHATGGGIQNQTLDPRNLIVLVKQSGPDNFLIGPPSSVYPFYGIVYQPTSSSTFTIANGAEVYGAISTQNLVLSGNASVHYDINLRTFAVPGVDQAVTITDWRELPAAERAVLP